MRDPGLFGGELRTPIPNIPLRGVSIVGSYVGTPAEITETLGVGILEGALAECGEVPYISFGSADLMHTVIDIRWGEAIPAS